VISRPQIAVILSTYQRPFHLYRSLVSLAMQRGVEKQFEVVVTDDGSMDNTAEVVERFASTCNFPVTFTTHEHRGFHLSRCRNEGVLASSAPYLLFSDGDCIFPPNHLFEHLRIRRTGVAFSGDCLHLDQSSTSRIDEPVIAAGAYCSWVAARERRRIQWRWFKDRIYQAIRHPKKPKLVGSNIGIWRSDFERVNGFDECFVEWGCEDDDLADRLRACGVRIATNLGTTSVFHMWHSSDPSQPRSWSDGHNVDYLLRQDKQIRCAAGLAGDMPFGRTGNTRILKFGSSVAAHRAAA
jgi:glycosyltransferase involved in cell wall biosynthesis